MFADAAAKHPIEFRDASGRVLATTVPGGEPLIPWEPEVTQEEVDRRTAEPGFPFEEVKKRLGWE